MGRRSVTENEKTPSHIKTVKELDESRIVNKPTKSKMTKSTKRSKCTLILNVDMGTESIDEYVKPIHKDDDIILDVECGPNKAMLYLSKLCTGSKGPCVSFQSSWLTPNEFQYVSGRETAKDWKRSIRHQGKSIKLLLSKGILEFKPLDVDCESNETSQRTGKKRKSTSGKRQKKKASGESNTTTPLSTTVESQLQETESQSSNSTIENSFAADDLGDTVSESDKQTDDSNNGDGETDSSADTQTSNNYHSTVLEENGCDNSGNNDNSEMCSDTEPCSPKQEGCDKEETLQTTENTHSRTPSPTTPCSPEIDAPQKADDCVEDDKSDLANSQVPNETTNIETDLNKNDLETKETQQESEEILENKMSPNASATNDEVINQEYDISNSEDTTTQTSEGKPELCLTKDDSNNNIADGELINSLTFNDDIKENKSADTISQDILSPQETNISPPRESRLQSIIEQLRVNKQKGIHKYYSITDNQAVTTDASSDENNESNECQEQNPKEKDDVIKTDDIEKVNGETSENNVQEENSCSRTEGRCSVKDKETPRKRNVHGPLPDNCLSQDSTMRVENVGNAQERTEFDTCVDATVKRQLDQADSYMNYHKDYLESDLIKRHKPNDYIKLSKPSKSDIIVNGLLDTIYTEKKREQQLKEVKKDTVVSNSELVYSRKESNDKMADMFSNNKYTVKSDRIEQNCKAPQNFKLPESQIDLHRSQKSENKLTMHMKSQGPKEDDTAFRSTLPRSPKSGSTYPSSFMNLKSKDSRSDKVHGQTAPTSVHKSSEIPKNEKASTSHPENIYNDYMRLLAATQSNFHLIPHPAVDPYFMMRMSEFPYPSPYFHPNMLKRDMNLSSTDKTDISSSSALNFMPPPFPPMGMLQPGFPFGFPPAFPDAYKDTVSPNSGSICKKSNVSPGSASAKRRSDEEHDALDLSAKKPKYAHEHSSRPEAQRESYKGHKTLEDKINMRKLSDKVHHTDRSNSGDPLDYRKLHYSWIDKSDKVSKSVCKCSSINNEDIRNWTVEKVYRFVAKLDGCSSYAEIFREHRLDGKRLPFLTTEQLVKSLGMKVGPAITLNEAVTRKIQEQSRNFQPCEYCTRKSNHRISI